MGSAEGAEPTGRRGLLSLSGPRVVLVLLAVSLVGAAVDLIAFGEPAEFFAVAFVAGSVLAAVLARRSALFVAGVQPPLAFVGYGIGFSLVLRESAGQGLLTSVAVDTALWMTTWFPVLAAATIPAVVIAATKAWWWRRREPSGSPEGSRTTNQAASEDSVGGGGTDDARGERSRDRAPVTGQRTVVRNRPATPAPRHGEAGVATRISDSPQRP